MRTVTLIVVFAPLVSDAMGAQEAKPCLRGRLGQTEHVAGIWWSAGHRWCKTNWLLRCQRVRSEH